LKRDALAPIGDTTELLQLWSRGDSEAGEKVLRRLYPQLKGTAIRMLGGADLTCHPSDILNDVWVRLLRQRRTQWQNRAHFFAIVARMLRRTLADHQKSRRRQKRDVSLKVSLEELNAEVGADSDHHFLLDQALERLALIDPIAARTVELRYFCGLSFDETAAALEIGRASAFRRWRFARAFLYQQMRGEGHE